MCTQTQILNILKAPKPEQEKPYPISAQGLFGSYARGDHNGEGDIDILVDLNGIIDALAYIRLAHELEAGFTTRIDLVSRKGIKPGNLPFVEKSLIQV